MSFRPIVKSSVRVPGLYSNDETKDQIIQKWDPISRSLVNIRILFKVQNVSLGMNATGFIAGWYTNRSGPAGVITIYDNGNSLVPGGGTPFLTVNTPLSNKEDNELVIPAEFVGDRNYYFILDIDGNPIVSNVVSYSPTLIGGPTTSVTSSSITSNFQYDLVPFGATLKFYNNGLTNSNVGGTEVATVSPITNKINSISRSNSNIVGNYYYSAVLSNTGILYKSPPVRLFPILNSVTLASVNSTTDVITVSNVNVSPACNLSFQFKKDVSVKAREGRPADVVTTSLFTRILSSSSAASYASSGTSIQNPVDIKYYVIIQALDSNGNSISESGSETSAKISIISANPTVNTATVSSVTPTGYTTNWALSIPSRVKVTLYINNSDSNTGGTIVSSRTFNVEQARTQNITETILGTGFYYVVIQPVDYGNLNIGTSRNSTTFFTAYALSVSVTSFSATEYVASWALSRVSNNQLLLYSTITPSNTGGTLIKTDSYVSSTTSGTRTVTGLSLTPTTRYYYVVLQPRTAGGANYGRTFTSAFFGNPTVSAVALTDVRHGTNRYTVTWTIGLASRVRIILYCRPSGGSDLLVNTSVFDSTAGVNTRTVRVSLANVNRNYYVIVQPVRADDSIIGTPLTSSVVESTNT